MHSQYFGYAARPTFPALKLPDAGPRVPYTSCPTRGFSWRCFSIFRRDASGAGEQRGYSQLAAQSRKMTGKSLTVVRMCRNLSLLVFCVNGSVADTLPNI